MQTELKLPSRESKHQLMRINAGVHFSSRTGGIYETSKREVEPDSLLHTNTSGTGKPWARWGTDNNYPQRLIDAVMSDPAAALLEKRRAMHWGSGLLFYRKRVDEKGKEHIDVIPEDQIPQEIEDFMFLNDFSNFQEGIIGDFEWWNCFCVQYITDRTGRIIEVKWQRTKDVRSELRNKTTGKIDHYYLSGNWPSPNDDEYVKIPAFDRMGTGSGIYKHQFVSIDKDYNPQPAWHAINRWLYVAGKIPRWILANIDNSINFKYHVKIPLAYFLQRHPVEMYKTAEDRNQAIQRDEADTYQKIDDYLTGEENVHKAFYSKVAIDDQGKPLPGWEIIPIDNKIQDEAWLRAYGTASMAITSGIGLSPSIGGQILPNGLGSGSGSDLREQFNFYMQVMTAQPRQTTLEPWEIIKRRNKWPKDIHLGYRDVILQSTDESKGGFTKKNEASPTTDAGDNDKTQP